MVNGTSEVRESGMEHSNAADVSTGAAIPGATDVEFELPLDGTQTMEDLTGSLNTLCGRAEDLEDECIVVLRLTGPESGPSTLWPGAVGVQLVNRWERAVRRLERLPAITIAVVQGTCGGPALELLLASDYRIGSPDLRVLLPVNDGQFWPGMAMYRLVHQVGAARSRQLVLWGHEIAADRCLHVGLVDDINSDIDETVAAARVLLGRQPGAEVAIRRQLLLEATSTTFDEALGTHLAACDRELRRLQA